ncbi:hypothetical protein MSG28_006308 [Choristoneura fumiferana]|uniref:Uncharacterized protein n=1 Tax=Choristoneura fumiferana TaxID=7141 RepID=A0ACC0JEM1_CHOFU|nr:hypothetical protein MSG28_006308 [Choristoneura fumiferana]
MSTDGSDGGSSIIQACRACLDTKIMNYVQFDNKDGGWNELYQFCFGFSVKSEIGSQLLCSKCADLVKCYAEFKKQCQKSEEFWCSILLNDAKYSVNVTDIKVEGFEPFTAENDAMADLHYTKDNNNIHDQNEEIDKLKDENDLSDRDDGFLFRHGIKEHLMNHADFDKYICEICGRGFKRLFNLKSHVSNRHKTYESVKCSHCNKTFKSEFNLQKHLKYEAKEKLFNCPVCPKKFPTEVTMKNHLFWHSDERPFSCEICGNKYKAKSQLKIHMRQHTGIMPFKCQLCEKSFASSNQLKVHRSVHTGIRRNYVIFRDKNDLDILCPYQFNSAPTFADINIV